MKAPISKLAQKILADEKKRKLLMDFMSSRNSRTGMSPKEAPIFEIPINGKTVKVQPRFSSISK